MIHLALFLLIIAAGFFDGICDSIKDLRTHRAMHPFRSFWHLCKHLSRLCLLGIGALLPASWWWDPWACAIVAVCGVIIGKFVWDATYACPEYWLHIDETLRLKTGWAFLDRILGFHWSP